MNNTQALHDIMKQVETGRNIGLLAKKQYSTQPNLQKQVLTFFDYGKNYISLSEIIDALSGCN